jgi:hypothetical protein
MWLVMFPLILLQYFVPYGILLFVIQISLPVSIFVFAKKKLVIQNGIAQLELLAALVVVNILIYLTAWNTNTHQNAIFWLTGVLAYVLPITLFFVVINLIIKLEKTRLDKFIILLLTFLLVGVQINYIAIFGLIGLLLFLNKKIPSDNFFKWFVVWAILSATYTWSYSGWLNRIQSGNTLEVAEKVTNFIHLLFVGILKEPVWSVSLFLLGIYLASLPSKNIYKHFIRIITWKVIAQATSVILVSAFIALIFAFIYVAVLERCAGCMTWTGVLLLILGGFLLGYALIRESRNYQDTEVDKRGRVILGFGIAVVIGTFLFLCVVYALRVRIQ